MYPRLGTTALAIVTTLNIRSLWCYGKVKWNANIKSSRFSIDFAESADWALLSSFCDETCAYLYSSNFCGVKLTEMRKFLQRNYVIQLDFFKSLKFHSFSNLPILSVVRGGSSSPGGLEIRHVFQQPLIILLIPQSKARPRHIWVEVTSLSVSSAVGLLSCKCSQ